MPCDDEAVAAVVAGSAENADLRIFNFRQCFDDKLAQLLPAFSINTMPGMPSSLIAHASKARTSSPLITKHFWSG